MDQEKKKSSLWHEGLFAELSKDWTDEQRKCYGGMMIPHEQVMAEIYQSAEICKFRRWLHNHFITGLIERCRIRQFVEHYLKKKK